MDEDYWGHTIENENFPNDGLATLPPPPELFQEVIIEGQRGGKFASLWGYT